MLALSKADLVAADEAGDAAAADVARARSARTCRCSSPRARRGQGLDELARELLRRVPVAEPSAEEAARTSDEAGRAPRLPARPRRGFAVERVGRRAFRVAGEAVDRLIARHDLENEEALAHVEAAAARAWA